MLSLEALRRTPTPSLIGSFATIQAMFEQVSRKTKVETNERIEPNFLLIDTFTSELAQPQAETPLPEQERRKRVEATLRAQLESALREHLRTPYHTDTNEIDWDKFASGKIHVHHRHYAQKDLRDHCQEAIDANTGAKRDRYAREKHQLDLLYTQHIAPELENFSSLTPAKAEFLSWEVRQAYGISTEEEVFVGKKHGLVMPANTTVYPDGYSYVNIHQLVYLPRQRRILVTLDQYFADLSYKDHRHILNHWQKDTVPKQAPLTEQLLMSTLVVLPEEVKNSSAFSVFLDLVKNLDSNKELSVRQKQQYSHGFVEMSKETLNATSTFLTQVLLSEYQLCLRHPEALKTLSQRLNVAFEMAAHPLLSGKTFLYQESLQSYTSQFFTPWLQKRQKQQTPHSLLQTVKNQSFIQRARSGSMDGSVVQQRNNALLQLSKSYPSILNSFLSQAQCTFGSIGGLTRMKTALGSSLGQSVLNGHRVNFSELTQLVGDRAEKFHHGHCVNPDCQQMRALRQQFGGTIPHEHLPYVGECSLCIRCELEYQQSQVGNQEDVPNDSLAEYGRRAFSHANEATSEYLRIFRLDAKFLGTFMMAEWKIKQ